jgi:hypothetical protein
MRKLCSSLRCHFGHDSAIRAFVAEDTGQDLLEYALAAGFIGIAGWLALNAIGPTVGVTYSSWLDPTTGAPSLWDPPAPAGGS